MRDTHWAQRLRHVWQDRSVHRRVWALALPMILSNLTVPLVALVNSGVVGHLAHPYQLGAVAVGAGFYTVVISLTTFLRMGTTGLAAQAAGRQDLAVLRRILVQSLMLAWILAGVLAALAWPLGGLAFNVMNPSPELRTAAEDFFALRLWGLPAILTQYVLVGWMLGLQNARAALAIMLITNLANIVLAILLVVVLDYGVIGAAAAAVSAEWAGAALALHLAWRYWPQRGVALHWQSVCQWSSWTALLRVNRDIFVRSLALQAVFLAVAIRGAQLGDVTVAANALLLNGLLCAAYALDGLAHAIEALCGHAIGRRNRHDLFGTLFVSSAWAVLISASFSLFFLAFGDLFVAMQSNMPAVRQAAHAYLPYLAVLPMIAVWSYILDGLFIGATRAREMRNAMVLSLVLTAPVAWAFQGLGNHGLWIALLSFMAIRSLAMGWLAWRIEQQGQWLAG